MPPSSAIVIAAIRSRSVVDLRYDDDASPRAVCPHVLYRSPKGTECLDAYQLNGPTHGGPLPGWRLFELRKVVSFVPREERFLAAPGYNPEAAKYRRGTIARVT
jgi:predicted DNA-binding transcriptional regulator YafY